MSRANKIGTGIHTERIGYIDPVAKPQMTIALINRAELSCGCYNNYVVAPYVGDALVCLRHPKINVSVIKVSRVKAKHYKASIVVI